MLIILVLLLVGFLTSGIHKVNIAWLILAAAIVCFLPGIGIGNEKSVMAIRWNAVFFMAVCLGIGTVFSAVGANQFISELILPLLMKATKQMALFLIWLLGALVNLLLTPMAAQAALVGPLVEIGSQIGLSTEAVVFMFQQGVNQIMFPYEMAVPMLMFSYGMMSLKQFFKVNAVLLVCNGIFMMLIMVPYWTMIGLV